MTTKKEAEFSEFQVNVANIAKALSHPARLKILNILSLYKTCNAMDIVAEMPLSQSTVSQHLKELKDAGLIKGIPNGTKMEYSIRKKALARAEKAMKKFFKKIDAVSVNE